MRVWSGTRNKAGAVLAAAGLVVGFFVPVAAVQVAGAPVAAALDNGLARTPPMGFNDWNAFGCNVNEQLIKQTADFFVSSGMRDAGYKYVNIDDCWLTHQRDPDTGRLVPDPVKFPDGIKGTADYVHSLGLKLGIYEDAGTATCAGYPGSLGHEQIDAQTFADWGVDYLKYDNCNNAGSTTKQEYIDRYSAMRDALAATGRPIVYSICEWGVNDPATWAGDVGNLWRTTGDISDNWNSLKSIVNQNVPLDGAAHPGAWNDPDMLEIGNGGMTDTEYKSHLSLWAEMAAPLLAGTDLREATPATMAIYLNKDVIAIDQDPLGVQGSVVKTDGTHLVFAKPLANGDVAVALFNEGDTAATMSTTAAQAGLPTARGAYTLTDLWSKQVTESAGTISAQVPAHGTVMYRVSAPDNWDAYPPSTAVSASVAPAYPGGPAVVKPGTANTLTTTFTNTGRVPAENVSVDLAAPSGWAVQAASGRTAGSVPTGGTLTTTWSVTPPSDATPGKYSLTATGDFQWNDGTQLRPGSTSGAADVLVPNPPPSGTAYVSDLQWTNFTNGWGPPERDRSNGETGSTDGHTITINGVTYAKGVGAHAPGEIDVYVGGQCASFTSDVGVDDEVGDRGSVDFQVYADGKKVADSGVVRGTDAAVHLTADLSGASFLRMVLTDGGDGNSYDHSDWAAAAVNCG
ncbi:MAG TPA: NPCBM/NEW2 domain-containing protein [Jatrophihabitans sp.]|nr:NPCBM/NEW2 domain-containing protein [Jatrophihabitans sp.]